MPDPDSEGGMGAHRDQVLDVRGGRGRLVHRLRQDRRPVLPGPRLHHRLHRGAGLGRGLGGTDRCQDGGPRRPHRRVGAGRCPGAGRQRDRRGGRLPAGHAGPQRHASRRGRPGHRPGRRGADVRHRVREAAAGLRPDHRRLPGHPVGDRQGGGGHRGGPAPHLPFGLAGRPGQVRQGVRTLPVHGQVLRHGAGGQGVRTGRPAAWGRPGTWRTIRPSCGTATPNS